MNIYEPVFFFDLLQTIPDRIITFCTSGYNFMHFRKTVFFYDFFLTIFFFTCTADKNDFINP